MNKRIIGILATPYINKYVIQISRVNPNSYHEVEVKYYAYDYNDKRIPLVVKRFAMINYNLQMRLVKQRLEEMLKELEK